MDEISEKKLVLPEEEDIETVIDRLQAFVNARKRVSVQEASKALAISANQTEKLATLLEESGLLRIQYKLTGVELLSIEEDEAAKARAEAAKKEAKKNIVLEESDRVEREVMTTKGVVEFMEKDLTRRIQFVENLLKDLETREVTSPEELKRLRKDVDLIIQQAAVFQSEVKKLEAKEDELSKIALEFNSRLRALEAKSGIPAGGKPAQASGTLLSSVDKVFDNLLKPKKPAAPAQKPPASPPAAASSQKTSRTIFGEKPKDSVKKLWW